MSEEFILKACKSFQTRVDTIIKKMVAILSKFTVFFVYLFLIKINFFIIDSFIIIFEYS